MRNTKVSTKYILVSLTLVLVLVFGWKYSAHAEIVEKLAHRDHGANGEEGIESPDPPETTIADVFPPFQVDAGSIITGIDYKFNSTQDLVDAVSGGMRKIRKPTATIALSDSNLQPGSQVSLLASPSGFDTVFTEQYFSWCLGTREARIAQNGLVAGGSRIPSVGNKADCYDDVQRLPAEVNDPDRNGDGMGDQWETRYFGSTRVDASIDTDQDGYKMDATNSVVGPNGVIRLVPNSYVTVGRSTTSFTSCDGTFTNGEEWVWGTNPIDPDTDDDGYGDEEDVCGKGQVRFEYTAPENSKSGDSEFLELIADGYATYRTGNGSEKLAKISNVGQALYIGNGAQLSGALEYKIVNTTQQDPQQDPSTHENLDTPQQDIYVGDEVEFHVAVDNSQDDLANLHYQWTFELLDGGVDTPKTPGRVLDTVGPLPKEYAISDSRLGKAGFGLNPYRLQIAQAGTNIDGTGFKVAPKTGNTVRVTVKVIEPETGKKVEIQQEFPLAISLLLDFSPELPIQPLYPQAPVTSAPSYTVTAVAPGVDTNAFLYEWYLDHEKQPNAHIGGNTLTFSATKAVGSYDISVVLTRVADESQFAEAHVEAPVQPLQVEISNCTQFTQGQTLSAGQSLTLLGVVHAQGDYPGELNYQWFVNDKPITDPSSGPTGSVTFVPDAKGSYNVRYTVESVVPSEASATPYVPISISDTCKISVDNGAQVALSKRVSSLVASAVFALPAMAKGLLTFFGIIVVIFVIILLVRNQHKNKS